MASLNRIKNLSLHHLRNSPFRIPPQDSIFLPTSTTSQSKGTNFGIFSPFSSISQKRFYSMHPPPPPNEISIDFKSFLEWYQYKSFETVPYTNRTRRVLYPRSMEKWQGDINFKNFMMENEGMLLPSTHSDVVRVKMVFNNIISALQRDLKKMGNASSSYNSVVERIWMSLLRRVPPASTSHLDGLDWEVLVVNNPDFHDIGLCFPGGKIVVSQEIVVSDILIATIVSHEVAHLVARHHGEMHQKITTITSLCYSLGENFTKHFGSRIASLIPRLPSIRRHEFEADYIGLLLLASAGYDPQQVPKVFEMMTKLDNFDNGSMLGAGGYLISQPFRRKRAKALAKAKIMEKALAIYNDVRADHGVSERV